MTIQSSRIPGRRVRASAAALLWALVLANGDVTAQVPVEIDRTLQRVHGTPIMSSDVRQARVLRLFDEKAGDEDILRELENRLLVLHETARNARIEPAAEAIQMRREQWRRSLPSDTNAAALLARAGATEQWLDGWFRDSLRIEAYFEQRFGHTAERGPRIEAWLLDLRRRANIIARSS